MYNQSIIKNTILQLAGKQSYKGFVFVTYGLSLTINDRSCLQHISKSLYIDIASEFNTSWQNVERDIRTLIDVIWRNKDNELLKRICNGKTIHKPNNKEFFLLLSDYILSLDEQTAADSNTPVNGELMQYLDCICRTFLEIMKNLLTEQENTNRLVCDLISVVKASDQK